MYNRDQLYSHFHVVVLTLDAIFVKVPHDNA